MDRVGWGAWLVVSLCFGSVPAGAADPLPAAAEVEFFEQKVRPILAQHCYSCHSHASGKIKGGLALDSKSGWKTGGDTGPAVAPGKPDESLLIKVVRQVDSDFNMPPDSKLSDGEIEILVEWVRRGAPDPRVLPPPSAANDWWSLQPLARPALPPATPTSLHPIDAFVRDRLKQQGLGPAPEADRRSLIRRLTFDLHGLPPTPEEVDAFVASQDPQAYEKLVERLLASPRYGERWARHWLDVVRYGDSRGNEHDGFRDHAWRYRDYVITALNQDTPYDRFVQEQLAADALFPERAELTAALGFLAAGPDVLSGNANQIRDEYVTTAMSAITSATVHCARCHHHKFDPISQDDYYALQSIFAGVQRRDAPVDLDPAVRQTRARWTNLKSAAAKPEPPLLTAENKALLQAWEHDYANFQKQWRPLAPEQATAASGAMLERRADGTVFLAQAAAESDVYTLRAPLAVSELRLLRLEALVDPRLPGGGPGLGEGGGFSLSEVSFTLHLPGGEKPKKLGVKSALADAAAKDQPIQRAHDNKPDTGWNGDPDRAGKPRTAVFELNGAPMPLPAGAALEITIVQQQGKRQQLGAFRWSATGAELSPYALAPAVVGEAIAAPPAARSEAQWLALAGHALPIRCEQELKTLPAPTLFHVVAGSLSLERPAGASNVSILRRGEEGKPIGTAKPGALSCVTGLESRMPPDKEGREPERRAWLARWLTDAKHPLTWRSIVNRVWQHHFGVGIVDTPNDLGQMGGKPSHPELLDWLAVEFRDGGRSLKSLHRTIVTSATYRQAVASNPAAEKVDAGNRLLWRMNGNRLDAECYRDAVLAVSGRLDLTMGGPGVLQFEVKPGFNTTKLANYDNFDWDAAPGRRSVYRFIFRTRPDPFMSAMDFPDASQFVPARPASISPLQALVLLNNTFVLRHSEHLAARIAARDADPAAQAPQAFRLALQRGPSAEEAADFTAYIARHGLPAACRLLLNSNEFLFLE